MTPAATASKTISAPFSGCFTNKEHTLIGPAVITKLGLPTPEDPALGIGLEIRYLGREPPFVERALGRGGPVRIVLDIRWRAETELPDDGRGIIIAVSVCVAGIRQI